MSAARPAPGAATPAFILTRDWRDTRDGIELTFWARGADGPLKIVVSGQRAVCFIERAARFEHAGVERRRVALKTPCGAPVDALYFQRRDDLRRLPSPLAAAALYETDVRPPDRYLMERFIQGPVTIHGTSVAEHGAPCFHNPRLEAAPSESAWRPSLDVASIDIETDFESGELFSIGVCTADEERVFLKAPPVVPRPADGLPVEVLADEPELLRRFLAWVERRDPDVLIGWNFIGFDLKTLEARCRAHGVEFRLGRQRGVAHVIAARGPYSVDVARVPGRVTMDGIESLRAAFYNFENFSLAHVARELLGRGKLIEGDDVHGGREVRRLYHESPAELVRYNLEDCRLVMDVFASAGLIEFAVERAASTGLAVGRAGGSVAAFDFLYLPRLHRRGYVAPDPPLNEAQGSSSPGGYVLDSVPGLYDDVLSFDFKSLYPSIIRTFLIDPLGLWLPGSRRVEGFDGASFSRDEPILPAVIERLWARRERARRDANAALSQALKIIMNSFYGVLGTPACRFFDTRLTSSITRRGHEIIRRSRQFFEEAGYRVIYGDTDSLFVWLRHGPTESEAAALGEQLALDLNRWWRDAIRAEHDLASRLEVEFETHYLKFLMPTMRGSGAGSKKRYAGMTRARDGGTRLVFKGLETVRTDWTPLAREFQSELFRRVFNGEAFDEFVRSTHERLYRGELDSRLIYRKRIRRDLARYARNVPPHVRAARKLGGARRWIRYVICRDGPQPVTDDSAALAALKPDYDHYSERQLKPVADAILPFVGVSYDELVGGQIDLFRAE